MSETFPPPPVSTHNPNISLNAGSASQSNPVLQKALSCVLCVQRKVKCNKRTPCSNCIKSRVQCVASTPIPRSRKYRVFRDKEALLARLDRCEKLLMSYGATREQLDAEGEGPLGPQGLNSLALGDIQPVEKGWSMVPQVGRESSESNLWISLSENILDTSSDEDTLEPLSEVPTPSIDAIGLLFDTLSTAAADRPFEHPQPVQTFQLWQAFLDNVHPMVMIVHAPTVQQWILAASRDTSTLSKPTEALLFSIYSVAVTSMSEEECETAMKESKPNLMARYQRATQQALTAANLLNSMDLVVLQAFVLYLISIRRSTPVHPFSILTSSAVRIAHRLKLHSESHLSTLPPFPADLSRRLWWQIVFLEIHASEFAHVPSTTPASTWSTLPPLNLNDSDLSPTMTTSPTPHTGYTEMTCCLLRYEVGQFQRNTPLLNGSWRPLTQTDIPATTKHALIAALEKILTEKFLTHLDDPGIPLHQLITGAAHSLIDRLRLMALHPHSNPQTLAQTSPELPDLCLRIIARNNAAHNIPSLARYAWLRHSHLLPDALVFLLHHLRHTPAWPPAAQAWHEILASFTHHRAELLGLDEVGKQAVYIAIGNLAVKAWDARKARNEEEPDIIRILRARRRQSTVIVSDKGLDVMEMPIAQACRVDVERDMDTDMDFNTIDWEYWSQLIELR